MSEAVTVKKTKTAGDVFGKMELLPEQEFECPTHGKYRGQPFKGGFFQNQERIFPPDCPQCEFEKHEREKEYLRIQKEKARIMRFEEMGIRKKYYDTEFSNFNAYTDELKKHFKMAKNFANNPDGKLVMLGENGTGKTHLAVSILKEVGGVMYTALEIFLMLQQSYNGSSQEWKILKELCERDLLIIDEIGRTKGSDWELDRMSHIINSRHVSMKPLILISNRHLRQDCPKGQSGCEKCLENFFDNDVLSRITEDGILLKFTGDDYRRRIGEKYREEKRKEANKQ